MKNRGWILVVLMMGTLMASLDNSVVNISLPTITRQFGSDAGNVKWIIIAYMLGFCVTMPLVGWLSQRLGFRVLFISVVALFTIASALCGLSINLYQLIGARVLQAVGGGAIAPTAMAMISKMYDRQNRGKAMGWWGLGAVVGPAIGPSLGGYITRQYGWPNIFFINIPIGALTVLLAMLLLTEFRKQQDVPVKVAFDFSGFAWLLLFIMTFQFSLSSFESNGLGEWQSYVFFAVAMLALFLFLKTEKKAANPVIDLTLFQNKIYLRCLIIIFSRSMALFGGLFLLPFLFQDYLHFNELESGLFMLPASVCMALLLPVAGKWADVHGSRGLTIAALILLAISNIFFTFFSYPTAVALILVAMSIRGLALGMLVSPITSTAINSLRDDQTTAGSSLLNLFMQIAASTGLSCLTLVYSLSNRLFLQTQSATDAQYHALSLAFWFAAGILLCAILPALGLPAIHVKRGKEREVVIQQDNHLRLHAVEK